MGHIFISYSHHDTGYAHRLADIFQAEGFDVWIDARIDYGSQWPHEVQKQLDACDVFVLVMTPRSFASEWVQSELQRAKRKSKPIFPLLLEGDEPWLSVESTQYYDVRGEKLPDARFYSALRRVVSPPEGQAIQSPAETGKKPFRPKAAGGAPKIKIELVIAIIGAIATLFAAVIPIIWANRSQNATPPPADNVTSTSPIPSSNNETPRPNATSTISSGVSANTPASSDFTDPKGVPMRLVSASNFKMGSDNGDYDEKPVHTVYLDDFHIDKYEVTNAFYRICVTAGACYEPHDISNFVNSQYADHPVVFVDWNMAKTYCEWRGAKLPTEAQWEKAARGTDGRTYPWGEGIDCSKANYSGCSEGTSSVMTYQDGMSPYGVYNMAGNVWEWVADWYSDTYYHDLQIENPPGPDSGELRVVRSGAWNQSASNVRASFRNAKAPPIADNDIGFRCAIDGTP
ncbi:MAG TPA: SUMF1/EgtB/PvdO family nonheme iron enzyme [Anaerolineales bacterium]|nr:SUMF1/EgtB/PvdO family nonheme iron enzyme [Anaerolineales bacterium]